MSKIRYTLVGICVASLSLSVMAQTADEHKAHHPAGSTSPASTQMKATAKPTGAGQMAGMAKMDEHMKAMQAMHEKMLAAKTPEERQALMDEHNVIALPAGTTVLRLLPPLIISEEEVDIAVNAIASVIPA